MADSKMEMAAMKSREEMSLHLSHVLDKVGYSKDMVQFRRWVWRKHEDIHNSIERQLKCFISGSKGEGLSKPFESDTDAIVLVPNILCIERKMAYVAPPNTLLFTFNPDYKYPGYSLIESHSLDPGTFDKGLIPTLVTCNAQIVLSSYHFVDGAVNYYNESNILDNHVYSRHGPAIHNSWFNHHKDEVYAIPSVCPTIMKQWLERPRKYDWPSLELRTNIKGLKGNFVAKGCKQSPDGHHEWRLCFSRAELLLVHSWEESLYKLYILLKIILKDILRPLDKEEVLSSYVMKNIVFWIAETNPSDSFQNKNLCNLLTMALNTLKESLGKKHLSNYMIPDRNLIDPDMDMTGRNNLIERVQSLVNDDCLSFLFTCEKLQYTTRMTDRELAEYGAKRDELEKRCLKFGAYESELRLQGLSKEQISSDRTWITLEIGLSELELSPWPRYVQEKLQKCNDPVSRLDVLLG